MKSTSPTSSSYAFATVTRSAQRWRNDGSTPASIIRSPTIVNRFARRFRAVALPVTEAACREVLTLPCFPGLSETQIDRVIEAVRQHYRQPRGLE